MGQIAHKNIRTITFMLLALTMLWVAPASAQGVTGMLDGFSEAIKAGVDFLVLLALLVGVGAILFGLKLVVDKSNDRADVKNSHIAASRSEEHTSELQSLMRISYDVFCLK